MLKKVSVEQRERVVNGSSMKKKYNIKNTEKNINKVI